MLECFVQKGTKDTALSFLTNLALEPRILSEETCGRIQIQWQSIAVPAQLQCPP